MIRHTCLALASKRQPAYLVLAGRSNGTVYPLGQRTLRRWKHVQTRTEVKESKPKRKSPVEKRSSKKQSVAGTTKSKHGPPSDAAITASPFNLKLSELQELARTLGLSQTAPKAALLTRIQDALRNQSHLPPGARVLSIDLGIRNLAYALLTASPSPGALMPTVHAWNRVDLRSLSTVSHGHDSPPSQDFSPSSLSHMALALVQTHLLPLNPTHILVEKQRFRSAGGSTVLEWTVRVNSLESMLYAIFATLKGMGRWDGVVIPIDPRGVGPFLLEDEGTERDSEEVTGNKKKKVGAEVVKAKGSKENKKLKIALVGSWLRNERGVGVEGEGEVMRKAFLKRWLPKGKKGKADKEAELRADGADEEKGIEKLDDVADCLLQGVAWLRWEENKRKLAEELRSM